MKAAGLRHVTQWADGDLCTDTACWAGQRPGCPFPTVPLGLRRPCGVLPGSGVGVSVQSK